MNSEEKLAIITVAGIIGVAVGLILLLIFSTPSRVRFENEFEEAVIKADLETDYHTSIETETTLRSYRASYESDKITYETNKDSTDKESQELARAAKTRANRTAVTYNNLLQHSLLDHIKFPEELEKELPYIE